MENRINEESLNTNSPIKLETSKGLQSLPKGLKNQRPLNKELNSFLLDTLSSLHFKSMKCINFFYHLKGNASANSIRITKKEYKIKQVSIKSFRDATKLIKANKDLFNPHQVFKQNELKILGTFLAFDFSTPTHYFLFTIGREDFLDFTEEEVLQFKKFITFLPFQINLIFKNEYFIIHNALARNNVVKAPHQQAHLSFIHNEKMNLLGELLNTLKHELSNPLFGLQLSLELLQEEVFNSDELKPFIYEAKNNIARSQNIIENFSKLFSNTEALIEINIKKFTEEILTLTKSETRGVLKEINIEPNLSIYTYPSLLAQALFNLIINAAQAKATLIRIKAQLSKTRGKLVISVIDNGVGIPSEQLPYIYEAFYTTKSYGTGLGLYLTQNYIKILNGTLLYQAKEEPKETHFIMELPITGKI